MLSKIPIELSRVRKKDLDAEIARTGIMAEYDAINLYQQMAAMATSPKLKKVLMAIAKEEKEHVGEFQAMLLSYDREQAKEMKEGEKEVRGIKD